MMYTKKIFIHIPKTGGTSLLFDQSLDQKIIKVDQKIFKNQNTVNHIKDVLSIGNELPEFWHGRWKDIDEKYTKSHKAFAIIRNPWSRVVSRFFYAKQNWKGDKKSSKYINLNSFEDFLNDRLIYGKEKYMWLKAGRGWYPGVDYITDNEGNIQCDVLSFENYDEDIRKYLNMDRRPIKENGGNYNIPYTDLYTPKTIQIVADWYKSDIDMFGYDFDTGPTKNTWKEIVI